MTVVVWADPSLGLPVNIVTNTDGNNSVPVFVVGHASPLFLDASDYPGVLRAANDLQSDIERVGGTRPELLANRQPQGPTVIIVGSYVRSALIKQLIKAGKIPTSDIAGKWESFSISTVENPMQGVSQAVVIAGGDERGTIYGIYELSEQLGVSPWYWWADVPVKHRPDAYVLPGHYSSGEPAVRYRGIFINDEAPCLTGWVKEKFGGFNSKFYVKVFELLLRLRGNFLWPAMWDSSFDVDDPENPRLANEYGIVMGTSHHEPMMRAHKEWTELHSQYGNGQWNYATNGKALDRFFREGIDRTKNYENVITIGMRGDGDEAMVSTGTMQGDIALLKQIMSDQRDIVGQEMHVDPAKVPQLWALFTEVQKYYDNGLRPPDDVTLLWTDDNVGNLRRLPTPEERKRSGGAGIYYHFDMHGGPYSYQWINTNPFPKIAEQMHLAYKYGATQIWIANIGDLKPLELPLEFFLRMAWNPAALNSDTVESYTLRWAERDFGPTNAKDISDLVTLYTKYNGWRKPELVRPDTYSQSNYDEADRVEAAWRDVVNRAEKLYKEMPADQRAAFYELVLYPAKASALVTEMNIAAGRNHLFAKEGRASSSAMAGRVRELFHEDRAMTNYYNHQLAGGKWDHLMDQTHLGEFDWQPPVADVMPEVSEVIPKANRDFGVSIEGSVACWPYHYGDAVLPVFDSFQPRRSYIDVFPLGQQATDFPADFSITPNCPWIIIAREAQSAGDRRYDIEIDWEKVPEGKSDGIITVAVNGKTVHVAVPVIKATAEQHQAAQGRFASLNGPISFSGDEATTKTAVDGVCWKKVPDYGRGDGAMEIYPVTAGSVLPPTPAPQLEYPVYLPRSGTYEVTLVLGPVMDFVPYRGMRIALSFDDVTSQVLDIFSDRAAETFLSEGWWNRFTRDNVRYLRSRHMLATAGSHTLKIAMVDPGIVLEKIIISDQALPQSYFGPPEYSPVR